MEFEVTLGNILKTRKWIQGTNTNFSFIFFDVDNNPSDDMPIIAVMVALSSLLVIIFIIIILYMLRLVKCNWCCKLTETCGLMCSCYYGNPWLAFSCEAQAMCFYPTVFVCMLVNVYLCVLICSWCDLIDRFKKYKQAGSHSNSFRLTNGRSDDTGEHTHKHWMCVWMCFVWVLLEFFVCWQIWMHSLDALFVCFGLYLQICTANLTKLVIWSCFW